MKYALKFLSVVPISILNLLDALFFLSLATNEIVLPLPITSMSGKLRVTTPFINLDKLSLVNLNAISVSGIVIVFVGATITDLSAKVYLLEDLPSFPDIPTLVPPLNFNVGVSNKSKVLKNSGKSYIANSCSKVSLTLAVASMFFIVEIVFNFSPGLTRIF